MYQIFKLGGQRNNPAFAEIQENIFLKLEKMLIKTAKHIKKSDTLMIHS
jgi:hypothetical protein